MSRRELSSPPSLAALYPRAVAVPLLRKIPGLGSRPPKKLPDTELEVRDVATDLDHLSDYTDVCGFERMDRLPATYPHIVAFPLAMRIMAERSFPFPLLGLVHIGNEITQHRPISPDEPLSVRVRAQDLEPHDRGTQFTMAAEARVGEELVWDSRNVYLRKNAQPSGGPRVSPPGRTPAREPGPLGQRSPRPRPGSPRPRRAGRLPCAPGWRGRRSGPSRGSRRRSRSRLRS